MRIIVRCAALAAFLANTAAAGAQDVAKGEEIFKKCKACHQVGPGAKTTIGPVLNEVIGAKAGARPDFKYSQPMTDAGAKGMVWTEENLHKYLADPKGFIAQNKMAFVGLKNEQERASVIAYLKLFSKPK